MENLNGAEDQSSKHNFHCKNQQLHWAWRDGLISKAFEA